MYQYFNYKLWSVLLAVIFLAGCPAVPVVENDQHPDSSDVDTATYHLVKAGETLRGIAELYGRDYQEIAAWNSLVPPYMLTKGLRLQVDGPNENVVLPPPHNDHAGIPVNPYSSSQTHTVQKGDTLYSISHQYGQTIADLARWNNILASSPLSIGQILQVSAGGSPSATFPPAQPAQPKISAPSGNHVVLKGDTLYNIAKHYGFSIADIAAWNGIQPPYRPLQLGENLRVTPYDANTVLPSPVVPATPVTAPIIPVVSPTLSGATIHTIAAGDTAYSIARKYGITVKNLTDWNNLEHPFILSIGQELRVSPSATMMPSTGSFQKVGSLASTEYVVKKGDNLEIIAQKFGISPAALATWNNFKVPYNIFPGMMLKLTP